MKIYSAYQDDEDVAAIGFKQHNSGRCYMVFLHGKTVSILLDNSDGSVDTLAETCYADRETASLFAFDLAMMLCDPI